MKSCKLVVLILSFIFFLQACGMNQVNSSSSVEGSLNNYKKIIHETYLYEIAVPDGTDERYFTTEYDSSYITKEIAFNVNRGAAHIFHSSPSCSPEVMGYPEITAEIKEDGAQTIWGKVYDDRGMGNTPSLEALCDYPPSPPGCSSIGENCDDGTGAYAFCSEKNDKRVVICISQQTDDPALAEEIFKSFRWVE